MASSPSRRDLKRRILKFLKNNGKDSFRAKELAKRLNIKKRDEYQLFQDVLNDMAQQHLIGTAKGKRYTYRSQRVRMEGLLHVNPRGFGFVTVEDEPEDIFIGSSNLLNALDGDRVLIGVAAHKRGDQRREGEVIEVLERIRKKAVGTLVFSKSGRFSFVEPEDQRLIHDIYVPRDATGGAESGDKVVVSIDEFDHAKSSPEGRVLEVLGSGDDPEVRVTALVASFDIDWTFPEAIEKEAQKIPLEPTEADIKGRLDLREKKIFTIDPVDAKDFDDAIHIERLPNTNFEVGVHIADVSHYVEPGGPIDKEAYDRATSVYLVDRTIPMLPEHLSNGVCSLRPNEDKLAYSCIMEVTPEGGVVDYSIRETVIHSKHRLTYEEAQAIIEDEKAVHPVVGYLYLANQLAQTLTQKRMAEGAIDFDMNEVQIVLDEEGNVTDIHEKERLGAHRLVEEFMLLANRCVAWHIGHRDDPERFVYRVHDKPDADKIQQLANYVRTFGHTLHLHEGNATSGDLNNLLKQVRDKPEAYVIENAALRAMAKAKYSPDNAGHYGLGFDFYTHFTSPIRRYPDLMIHRMLKAFAKGGSTKPPEDLGKRCVHCSEQEQQATVAERESKKLKQVEYIRQHVGDTFGGVVSGVTNFGVFIILDDVHVEGMVHVRDLDDDYYEYDESTFSLVGLAEGRTFRPGDHVRVTVAAANLDTREVDLLLADDEGDS